MRQRFKKTNDQVERVLAGCTTYDLEYNYTKIYDPHSYKLSAYNQNM